MGNEENNPIYNFMEKNKIGINLTKKLKTLYFQTIRS